ncbi:MAG: hypothetical protein NC183_02035 [Corallococcus sp.]|nr:hypothetical protein [Corallococcus sp.]MCM1359296.1 hypothetical protein [Corallococcus sp.]
MNLSAIALAIVAWKLFSDKQTREKDAPPKIALTDFLNDDAKTVIEGAEKLTSKNSNADEKMSAILGLIGNPTIMNLAGSLFGQGQSAKASPETQTQTEENAANFTNDEGYEFAKPSASAQEFFHPIDNVADAEVKSKLYWFYDNWYL